MCQETNCPHGTNNTTSAHPAFNKLHIEEVIKNVISRSQTKEEASLALTHLGALALESKNVESAEILLNKALEQQETGFVQSNLGTLYSRQNKPEEAKKHWHIAADTYQLITAQYNLARTYKAEKNNELAKKYYTLVTAQKTEYTALACFELAEIYATEENTQQEAAYLHKASDEHDFPFAHSTLGLMYMEKNPEKAQEYLTKALARRHDWAWENNEHILDEVHYNLGILFEQQNNPKIAKKYYKRAADHEHPGSCWRLAIILDHEQGNTALAIKYLHIVADKYDVPMAQWQLGWLYAGQYNQEKTLFYWHKAADEHKYIAALMSLSRLYLAFDEQENAQKYFDLAAGLVEKEEDKATLEELRHLFAEKAADKVA